MKKILVVAILLMSTVLMADGATEEEMKKTMQNMEISMAFLQKGFLYNHRGMVKKGITSLRRELQNINSFVIKNDESVKFNAHDYAIAETKALDSMASRILGDFDKGNKEAVMVDFQQMLNRCVTCHALVRKW